MAFVFSTDKSYTEYKTRRGKQVRRLKERSYVSFTKNEKRGGKTGNMNICADVARKVCMGAKAIVGLDKGTMELIIIPSLVGNIKVNEVHSGQFTFFGSMALRRFFLSQGVKLEDFPYGRYEATVDEENNIHVNLKQLVEVKED